MSYSKYKRYPSYYQIWHRTFKPESDCKNCSGWGLVASPMTSFSFGEVYCSCIMSKFHKECEWLIEEGFISEDRQTWISDINPKDVKGWCKE